MDLIVVFATNNGKDFALDHFGEAKKYLVYKLNKTEASLIQTVWNRSPEEKMHGDPNKAKGVAQLLKPYHAQVLVNKAFGKNIIRMQQKFVCVLSTVLSIDDTINNIQKNFDIIVAEWEKGAERSYLRI